MDKRVSLSPSLPPSLPLSPNTPHTTMHVAVQQPQHTQSVGGSCSGKVCKYLKEVREMAGKVGGDQRENGRHHQHTAGEHHHITTRLGGRGRGREEEGRKGRKGGSDEGHS